MTIKNRLTPHFNLLRQIATAAIFPSLIAAFFIAFYHHPTSTCLLIGLAVWLFSTFLMYFSISFGGAIVTYLFAYLFVLDNKLLQGFHPGIKFIIIFAFIIFAVYCSMFFSTYISTNSWIHAFSETTAFFLATMIGTIGIHTYNCSISWICSHFLSEQRRIKVSLLSNVILVIAFIFFFKKIINSTVSLYLWIHQILDNAFPSGVTD